MTLVDAPELTPLPEQRRVRRREIAPAAPLRRPWRCEVAQLDVAEAAYFLREWQQGRPPGHGVGGEFGEQLVE